ncbi:MAG: DUF3597 domain-containing protein [Pseudorhizobium sp.]
MSIFGKIKAAIFGHPAAAATASSTPSATPSPSAPSTPEPAATTAAPVGGTGQAVPSMAGAAPAPATATTATAAPAQAGPVDVASNLDAAVERSGQKLDWKHSIVDLMKALGMDASLAERKELADELGYSGDKNDSATMNMWLHKALMAKLAENGGKVPADLLD